MSNTKNLTQIVGESDVVLIDSSVYLGPLNRPEGRNGFFEYYDVLSHFYDLLEVLSDNYGNIYTTARIYSEMMAGKGYNHKRLLKESSVQRKDIIREHIQRRGRAEKHIRRFLKNLKKEGFCLDFGSEKDWAYQDLVSISADLISRHKISFSDLDLLLSSATLSKQGLEVSLLSNDFGIVAAWHAILSRSDILPEDLRFYVMPDFNEFREMNHQQTECSSIENR